MRYYQTIFTCFFVGLAFCQSLANQHGPVVVVSWDGAGNWVIQRLLKEHKLPNVQKLIDNGFIIRDGVRPPFPSITAVSHVSMFTGANPGTSGVSGNDAPVMPRASHTVLETRRGFDARTNYGAEPIWVTAAKAGKKVLALSAAGSYPPDRDVQTLKPFGAEKNYVEFSGFESRITNGTVYLLKDWNIDRDVKSARLKVGDDSFLAVERASTPNSIELAQLDGDGKTIRSTILQARSAASDEELWSPPFQIHKGSLHGNTSFRLFGIDPASGYAELYSSEASEIKGTEDAATNQAYMDTYGCFHDSGWYAYTHGQLGIPAYQGGDGEAERRAAEIVRHEVTYLKRSFRWGLDKYHPDLVFHYQPFTDSAGHTLMGALDPDCLGYKPDIAKKLMPLYESAFVAADEWLGDMIHVAGPTATFVLVSDHGMAGQDRIFYPNQVLAQAGLLTYTPDHEIDLTKTKVLAAPWNEFSLVVNTTDWKGGIVDPKDKSEVLQHAIVALTKARDGDRKIVTRMWAGDQLREFGDVGPACADIYYDMAPSYNASDRYSADAVQVSKSPIGIGSHGYYPNRPKMKSILVIGGPGIPRVAPRTNIRTIDVGPTICAILGIDPPGTSEGSAVISRNPRK
jgi:predicted AlkP superfamily phosphohydrolase/phosphomutase